MSEAQWCHMLSTVNITKVCRHPFIYPQRIQQQVFTSAVTQTFPLSACGEQFYKGHGDSSYNKNKRLCCPVLYAYRSIMVGDN